MRSEHTITVIVMDQNDSPSSPRSVHVIVHSFNEQIPLGKIADVHPNDPDITGSYSCKILQGSNPKILSIPSACDLYTKKITPGLLVALKMKLIILINIKILYICNFHFSCNRSWLLVKRIWERRSSSQRSVESHRGIPRFHE